MNKLLTIADCRQTLIATDVVDSLLTDIMKMSRAQLYAYPEKTLSVLQQRQWQTCIARYQQGEPLAYIVGHQPFWTLDLNVTPDTLIPRPETECLVEWLLSQYNNELPLNVLDLGTGSGAIALALAKERPNWQITASDKSEAALAVARENAKLSGLNQLDFCQSDWYQNLPSGAFYDIIVSNPPYIAAEDTHLAALQHEPLSALVAGARGLDDLAHIIDKASSFLSAQGIIVLEHGFDQAESVIKLLTQAGYRDIVSHRDLSQLPRFVTALTVVSSRYGEE